MCSTLDVPEPCRASLSLTSVLHCTRRLPVSPSRLKSKGVNISSSGVSVRTKSHYSHEDYVDATQRGLIRAMNASAFATSDSIDDLGSSSPGASPPSSGGRPPVSRQGSQASVMTNSSSTGLDSEGKRRRHFGIGKRAKD